MLEIKLIREAPETVKKDLERRGDKEKIKLLEEAIKKDKEYRALLQEAEKLKQRRNQLTGEITVLKLQKKDAAKQLKEAKSLPEKIKSLDKKTAELKGRIDFVLLRLPNLMHCSVPFGKDESGNAEIRCWGKKPAFSFSLKNHGELIESRSLADFERARKISGAGFFVLKGNLALLDLALVRFAIDELTKKGFTLVEPPFLMRRKPYEGVVDLQDFENVMYKAEGEDLYLIATSEHPLVAMHSGEIFEEKDLPLKYCGVSACFRKEIGKHSIDERGLFRVHQFNKVEQVVFCRPEDSQKFHEELLSNAESLLQKLELPYRVVNVCSGDLGCVASKKYDVEAWSPREEKFIELMSCSNCTSYQAVRLNIKYRKPGGEKEFVHTLNSTEVATSRALRVIIENYQTAEGKIRVPKVLQPYMNGLKEI